MAGGVRDSADLRDRHAGGEANHEEEGPRAAIPATADIELEIQEARFRRRPPGADRADLLGDRLAVGVDVGQVLC